MKKRFYQHIAFFLALSITTALAVSCDNAPGRSKSKNAIEVAHQFPNGNWAFEEEVVAFDFTISDTSRDYRVALSLKYDTAVAVLRIIPLSVTFQTPDGMQSVAASNFNLNRKENKDIRILDSGLAEATVTVFPKRSMKTPGTYHLTVYRRAEKADNYGFSELSAIVTPE